jgi:PurA ssDNA and RNA-binding protein
LEYSRTCERKMFFLDLQENHRGRFLKITEDTGGRRDTIMLPAEAFQDFVEALERLVEFESRL